MAYRYTLSSDDKNAYGYTVLTTGIDLSEFNENPVMLYNHDINKVLGRWTDIKKEEDEDGKYELTATAQFDDDDFSKEIEKKIARDYIIGVSVGAILLDAYVNADEELIVTKALLKECSITALPANKKAKVKKEASLNLSEMSVELSYNGEKDINKIKEYFMNKDIELTTFNNHPDVLKNIIEETKVEEVVIEEKQEEIANPIEEKIEQIIEESIIVEEIVEEVKPKSKRSKKVDELQLSETLLRNLNLTINEDEYIDSKIILTIQDLQVASNKIINDFPEYIELSIKLVEKDNQLENLKKELEEIKLSLKTNEVSNIVELAITEGKIKSEHKDLIIELAQNNIDTVKKLIDSINVVKQPDIKLTDSIKKDIATSVNKDWKWYQKNDPNGLKQLKLNNSAMFNKLYFNEYKIEYKG
jgi:HK97 family phage prohead protease